MQSLLVSVGLGPGVQSAVWWTLGSGWSVCTGTKWKMQWKNLSILASGADTYHALKYQAM